MQMLAHALQRHLWIIIICIICSSQQPCSQGSAHQPEPSSSLTVHVLHRLQQLPHDALDRCIGQPRRVALQVLQHCRQRPRQRSGQSS